MARQMIGAAHREREITEAVNLCDARGRLLPAAVGWSRRPLHTCNLSGHPLRKKRWNYWCFTSDSYLFSVTLASVDYMGMAFAYFLEHETGRFVEKTVTVPFGRGCELLDTVRRGVSFSHRRMSLRFTEQGDRTAIHVESPAFGGTPLTADLTGERPPDHETLNVVIPWSADRFQFTSKQNCLPAGGTVTLGEHRLQIQPDQKRQSYARARVEVQERLDGSLVVYYQGRTLLTTPAPATAPVLRARSGRRSLVMAATGVGKSATPALSESAAVVDLSTPRRPAPDHPWRRTYRIKERLTKSLTT